MLRSLLMVMVFMGCGPSHAPSEPVTSTVQALGRPPAELAGWQLSPRYAKHIAVHGFPVLGTDRVSDAALREAAYLIDQMVGHRADILQQMAANRVRFVVMAPDELTTDVPEHSDLEPKDYWDRRARGLGATTERPAVSCGEENLLDLEGDPYSTENILVHELSHAIHQMGVAYLDPTFDQRLQQAFADARAAGRWAGTYAMDNHYEYWAEGAQSWFDTNRVNDDQHGPIATRAQLVAYDPPLAALLKEVFGDRPWRYQKPHVRDAVGRAHLAGFDRTRARGFQWPERLTNVDISRPPVVNEELPSSAMTLSAQPLAQSPQRPSAATRLAFQNHRATAIVIEWIGFDGTFVPYQTLAPDTAYIQDTYVGHAWRVREGDAILGYAAAAAAHTRIDVR